MNETVVTELNVCCACGGDHLHQVLDLGWQPLANSYRKNLTDDELQFPLRVNVCESCFHVQLSHAVDPDLLFKHYLYVSGTTQTLKDNMRWFANFVSEYTGRQVGRVIDIGCNDGTQLDAFKSLRWRTYGIDPAENIVPLAQEKKHTVICDYFNADSAMQMVDIQPDAIVAQNVVAHNFDAVTFLRNVRQIMGNHTKFFMQISQADMIVNNEFDTCYHEHINFFNVRSLRAIAKRAGLHIEDIVRSPVHGTSYIVIMARQARNRYRMENLEALDAARGLYDLATYERWGQRAHNSMTALRETVDNYRSQGYKIYGYGAAAKGMVVINFARLNLDLIIDDNPLKQGYYTPGMNIPIVASDVLTQPADKILFVPLAWNFYAEIRDRIRRVRDNADDRFIRYFPDLQVE